MTALKDQPALVLGSQGPITTAIARRLAEEGAKVVVVGLREDIEGVEGLTAQDSGMPVTDEAWRTLLAEVAARVGAPVILVDVAGMPADYGLAAGSAAGFAAALLGRIEGTVKAASAGMAAAGFASVTCVGLPMGREVEIGIPAASVVRHATVGLVRGWAVELGDQGIRVNAVQPGIMNAPGQVDGQWQQSAPFAVIPLVVEGREDRAGRPEDIAEAVLFLACDDAAYVTGTEIVVDGGLSQSRQSFATSSWDRRLINPPDPRE